MKKTLFVFWLLIAATFAMAQETYEQFEKGDRFTFDQQQYILLPELNAVKTEIRFPDSTNPFSGSANQVDSNVFQEKGGFSIYQNLLNANSASSSSYPVVLNPNTEQLGIVLGKLVVYLSSMSHAASVAQTHGLELVHQFYRLRFAVYRVPNAQQIFSIADQVRANPLVRTVEIEVLEHIAVPQ